MTKPFNAVTESSIAYVMSREDILLEDRIDYLKANTKPIDTDHDTLAKHKDVPAIVDHFAEHGDPTVNKQHTQYILNLYRNKSLKQEDAYKVKDALTMFEKHKHKLSPAEKVMSVKNYPSITSISDKMKPFEGTYASKAEKTKDLTQKGHELKYEDDHIKIHHISNEDASKEIYGGGAKRGGTGTDWCTAARSDNCMFNEYHSKGPIHVVHRKSDGAVFQYHAQSNQFMDKNDDSISDTDFKSIAPSLHKAWKKDPTLVD